MSRELNNLGAAGLMQEGLSHQSPQGPQIKIGNRQVLNFASDNYLGFANEPRLKKAAIEATEKWGTGWSAGRLFSGTHALHQKLEARIAKFLQVDEALVFPTGYQASLGIFESLFNEQDYIFCDFSLHPSLVDGVRMCAGKHLIFKSHDLTDLEDKLKRSPGARFRAIVLEGVTSQDGKLSPLADVLALGKKYDALVMVEDSHGIGVLGERGRGITEESHLLGKVDLIIGSLTHAIGAGGGGFLAGRSEIISWLRQKSRSYLFSSSPSPAVLASAEVAFDLLESSSEILSQLRENTKSFRNQLEANKIETISSPHPIISILVGDALELQRFTNRLFQKSIFGVGFCYPVVPKGSAQLRLQVTALHSAKELHDSGNVISDLWKKIKTK